MVAIKYLFGAGEAPRRSTETLADTNVRRSGPNAEAA
jgi:hypothetical protein